MMARLSSLRRSVVVRVVAPAAWIVAGLLSPSARLLSPPAQASPASGASPAVREVAPLGDGRGGGRSLRVTEYRLTTETYSQYDPSISGVDAVFTQVEGTGEIFRCAINGEPEPLVTGPGNQFEPDLSGTRVVYTNDVTGLRDVWQEFSSCAQCHLVTDCRIDRLRLPFL